MRSPLIFFGVDGYNKKGLMHIIIRRISPGCLVRPFDRETRPSGGSTQDLMSQPDVLPEPRPYNPGQRHRQPLPVIDHSLKLDLLRGAITAFPAIQ